MPLSSTEVKAKKSAYNRQYREEHRTELNDRARAYHRDNLEVQKAKQAEYRKKHSEVKRAKEIERYHAKRNEINAGRRANRAKLTAQHRKWHEKHPGKHTEYTQLKRARKRAVPIIDLTEEQWQTILKAFDYHCAYCPDDCQQCKKHTHKLTKDHITPIIKKGPHTLHNIVPACASCNASKKAGPVPKPVQPLLL